MKTVTGRQTQRGFTLTEMMVAITIGTILMGGVIQIFITSWRSYQLVEGLSRIQENGRYMVESLGWNLRRSGYKVQAMQTDPVAFPTDATVYAPANVSFPTGGQIVSGTNNNANAADTILDGTDTITFRYQGATDGLTVDCLSNGVPLGTTAVNTYYVGTANDLRCRSGGQDQPLIDGVQNMQILYGVDATNNRVAGKYINAAAVTAAEWGDIVSVRINLLVNSVQAVTRAPDSQTYVLLDTVVGPFNDLLRRRVFGTTINLRNRTP